MKRVIHYLARFITLISISLAVVTAALLLRYLYQEGHWQFNYPDEKKYPVRGIDISNHQGKINWAELREENLQFIFIKATEGGDFKDKSFKTNWRGAADSGLVRGAYHFFTFCKPGKQQAKNFIDTVPVEVGVLPPVIDIEYSGNCRTRPTLEEFMLELNDYMNEIEKVYQTQAILYITEEIYDDYLSMTDKPLWIRDIYFSPRIPEGKTWLFWQYHSRGRVKGIIGPVDLNVFSGTHDEFKKLITSTEKTTDKSNIGKSL